jgi:hypothetical protein
MDIFKFPCTYLGDVPLMFQKGVVFRKVLKYLFWAD